MELTPGANTYNTAEELKAYAVKAGIDISIDEETALSRSIDYVESLNFSGSKTNPDQTLEFPRNGNEFVPGSIKKSQLVIAGIIGSQDGFQGMGENYIDYPEVAKLLKPFIAEESQVEE